MGLDGLIGIDLVAEGDVDVSVTGDDLGDMGWQPVQDRVGDEQPAEIVRREPQRAAGCRVSQAGVGERGGEHGADAPLR